jgi:hypothetical protein
LLTVFIFQFQKQGIFMTDVLSSIAAADLQVLLKPVNTFLTDLQQPDVNVEQVVQDFATLQVAAITDAPVLETIGIQNVAAALQTALNNWVASLATPAAPTPAPVVAHEG